MRTHLAKELELLQKHVMLVSSLVETAISKAVSALRERSLDLSTEVIEGDQRVDDLEVRVEEECIRLLALHQPVAEDLRLIASVMKINNDLERMGDLAVNIAERVQRLLEHSAIPVPDRIDVMAEAVLRMIQQTCKAFAKRDSRLAREICGWDDQIDQYHRETIAEILQYMQKHPSAIDRATHLLSVSRHLERIADHTTNIAEDVFYFVEGRIIRHKTFTA